MRNFSTKIFGGQNGEPKIWESKKQKLLGIEIDKTLSFEEYFFPYVGKLAKIVCIDYQISCVQIRA